MKRTSAYIFAGLLAMLAASFFSLSASAAEENDGVDIVMILDNSGSMRANDQRALRVEAARMFVNLLSERDRISILRFSGETEILSEMLPLSDEKNRNQLLNSIDRITSDGAHTDIYHAIERGAELLNQTKRPNRMQHIILMTDGKMDVGKHENDVRLTDKLLGQLAPVIAKNHIKIHGITFTEKSNMPLLDLISRDTHGSSNLLRGENGIHEVFQSIFERSVKPDMLPMKEDSFVVDKAVDEITVVVSKYRTNAKVGLETPDGDTFYRDKHPSRVRWYSAKQFDLITIKHPSTGYWLVKFSEGGNKAYIITNLKLIVDAPAEVKPGAEFPIEIWFEQNGKPAAKNEFFLDTKFEILVTGPNGQTRRYTPHTTKKGRLVTTAKLDQPGDYRIDTSSIGELFDRQRSTFVRVIKPESTDPFAMLDEKYQKETSTTPNETSAKTTNEQAHGEKQTNVQTESQHEVTNVNTERPAQEEDSHGKKIALLVFLIINIVAIIAGGVWFWLRKRKNKAGINLAEDADVDDPNAASDNLSELNLNSTDDTIAMEEDKQ